MTTPPPAGVPCAGCTGYVTALESAILAADNEQRAHDNLVDATESSLATLAGLLRTLHQGVPLLAAHDDALTEAAELVRARRLDTLTRDPD